MVLSINTDDPKMFGNSLAEEYMLLVQELDLVFVVTSEANPADSRTTLHYTYLFDLVASAVIK